MGGKNGDNMTNYSSTYYVYHKLDTIKPKLLSQKPHSHRLGSASTIQQLISTCMYPILDHINHFVPLYALPALLYLLPKPLKPLGVYSHKMVQMQTLSYSNQSAFIKLPLNLWLMAMYLFLSLYKCLRGSA
jgi:hypothetical protein